MTDYGVRFLNTASGLGFVDGYRTARRAKEVVATVNATTERTGIVAEYLGKDSKSPSTYVVKSEDA